MRRWFRFAARICLPALQQAMCGGLFRRQRLGVSQVLEAGVSQRVGGRNGPVMAKAEEDRTSANL